MKYEKADCDIRIYIPRTVAVCAEERGMHLAEYSIEDVVRIWMPTKR